MPAVSRRFVRAGLVYLVLGMALGVLLPLHSVVSLPWWIPQLRYAYLHLLMVGWLTQLIFGVAYWMFPKASRDPDPAAARRVNAAFWMLNAGLLLRVVAEPAQAVGAGPFAAGGMVVSAVLQWLAGMLMVFYLWGRVVPPPSRRRT